MPLYRTSGTLTGTIFSEHVATAQAYLSNDDMTQFMDESIAHLIEHIEWKLDSDGYHWSVTAFTRQQLMTDQLRVLSDWVSGQNSDGLGEGFEQQDFAWQDEDCDECSSWYGCQCGLGSMISFDWKTNKCEFVRIK